MNVKCIYAAAALLIVACVAQEEPSANEEDRVTLSIADVGVEASKSVVEGDSFPDTETCSMGIYLTSESGGQYDGGPYCNVEFIKAAGTRKWSGVRPVDLAPSSGILYAYYPYAAGSPELTAVPVHSSIDGEDYLYSVPVSGVSASDPEVSLKMKHALALVCVNISKGTGYSGECQLTSISLSGEGIAAEGTLDISTGEITAEASDFLASGIDHSFSGGLCEKMLVVPALVSSERQKVKLACTIDGDHKSLTFESSKGIIVKQGVKFSVNLTVSGTGLKISGISITGWNGETIVDTDLIKEGIVITGGESGQYGGEIEF